ncbi:1-phosphatidylinositol 4,5-bisphosphate phosphodiesterase gamma-1 isoform X2 [Atheta coriaria]|uniref:1-phosphatidylinositol 4,5-bisphosphate phosphodiesterase gamma-1 isoform X2 n=1 Tax=Dalotia coriaria TaxID=877792 RepID=UPI0031F42709
MLSLQNGPFVSAATGYIPEMEQIISQLERSTLVTKFSWRKKVESKSMSIRRETNQVVWCRPSSGTKPVYDGAVDIREIKEVRFGKQSKDFEKWPEEAKKMEHLRCFVVYYGSEFKLRALSIAALSEKECELWTKGLRYLMQDSRRQSYPTQVQIKLRTEFYAMENPRESVSLKEIKSFFPRLNCKIPTSKLREYFNEVDTRKRNEIGFDDFSTLYHKLMYNEKVLPDIAFSVNTANQVTLKEFQTFLLVEQKESSANDPQRVSALIRDFLKDPQRDCAEPYFLVTEFVDFLFSKQNDLWDTKKDTVYQDMTKPMSHYWIASSHNTYLTGDQFSSESSVEAYVRCLRMGCRCIELDCWDGPDGMPFIYHGHTLTTRIKFMDVIRTIKEHAFVTSEYPVILSIEDNCSLPQQRKMATAMQEVFGDMLLIHPVEKNEKQLPSPHQLRRRIILKHKKLPEGQEEATLVTNEVNDLDLRNSVKNGIMYLEDPVDKEWNPHFFVLTPSKLFYIDKYKQDAENERSEDEDEGPVLHYKKNDIPNEELHFAEKWFHGRLPNGRDEAEQLLKTYSNLGDGTFLVRASVTFVGEYCLSFWRNGLVNHCRIRSKQDKQQTKYYLTDSKFFDSLYSLITHYRSHPLVTHEFSITLSEPVPQPKKHEGKDWYHQHTTRLQAEEALKCERNEGAFLVRQSENDANSYTISFRADKKIKHCRIKREGRLYTIGSVEFESLVELINYYEHNPLYRKVKLMYAINEDAIRRMGMHEESSPYNATPSYMDPSSFSNPKITVKAKFDYKAQQSDELSFCKHSIITNVVKPEGSDGWWRGDYGGKKQHYFPAIYVVEIQRIDPDDAGDESTSESVPQGQLDVNGAVVEIIHHSERQSLEWTLKISTITSCSPLEVAVQSKDEALEWLSTIRDSAAKACVLESQAREMERAFRIAKEMSDLIIYCRSITFNLDRAKHQFLFYEMSSFPENKAEKLICQQENKFFLRYHQVQFSRVYPKGQRIDSSNYNPINIWNSGSQMVALNYQTGDKPMQLNQAKFRDNGRAGYLLKPAFMFRDDFDPYDKNTLVGVDPLTISIRIIAARHLQRLKKGTASPFVEIEIYGADFDAGQKLCTKTIADNGFNPRWNEICEFDVANPSFALLRFTVQDEDVFGDPNFIGQATYPVTCLRTGYRSVWLKNNYSEDLELASLLIHISIKNQLENFNHIVN